MQRIFARLFSHGPSLDEEVQTDEIEVNGEDHIEAVRDLRDTYNQPIKCSYQKNFQRFSDKKNSISILRQHELGLIRFRQYPQARYNLMKRLLPEEGEVVASMERPTFCGQFSDDGQCFISACQDNCIRLYDTSTRRKFAQLTEIEAIDVGWSILDTALSPDRTQIAYSTWSDCIYLITLDENYSEPKISSLYLRPETNRFSVFSLQFSKSGSEIICGASDNCVYIFDLEKQQRTLRVEAHRSDVNAVRFIDDSNALLASGSDDGLVLVWDRRALNEAQPKPVGTFAGHKSGITFVHSRMDSRYLISNSKDQSIKLWDMRRFADESAISRSLKVSNAVSRVWDYRVGVQSLSLHKEQIPGDPSVCTYREHSVGYTLIRCYFSPAFTTGQRYIITGSSNGCVYIYDVLTGSVERCLRIRNNYYGSEREKCVRDVAWHPYDGYIVSTSWDNRRAHVRWTHKMTDSSEPCLSPPVETKTVSVQTPSSPSLNHSTELSGLFRRYLLQQSHDSGFNVDSDDEDDGPF
ncbi:unnamed protein product [Adineta ricciae]|uniref:Uncharacterized protein n=1 Tax=Adineta ricciae TaxID=249248 RepID=A0A814A290_ADIRI|nr:unnamed protein product [Adineta ricciae]CAF1414459.1 unnamed protein product [Adineta ricciae]